MKQSNRGEVLVLVVMLVVVGLALYYVQPVMLKIRSLPESEILALISTLFVLAVFVERANESILIPIRTPDKQKIELELEGLRALPTNDDVSVRIRGLEVELSRYRLGTAKRAYWISLGLGILISIVGVRIIGELVVVGDNLKPFQKELL